MVSDKKFYDEITPRPYQAPRNARKARDDQTQIVSDDATSSAHASDASVTARAGESARHADVTSAAQSRRVAVYLSVGALIVALLAYLFIHKVEIAVIPESASVQSPGLPMIGVADNYYAPPGEYEWTFSAPGYKSMTGQTSVAFGADNRFVFEMEKLPGHLEVVVTPASEATVYIDGVLKGKSPARINNLSAGQYEIGVRSDGYKAFTQMVEVTGLDVTQTLTISLMPEEATLHLATSPAGAQVDINKQSVGKAPLTHNLRVNQQHTLLITKPGYEPVTKTVRLKQKEQKRMTVTLRSSKSPTTEKKSKPKLPRRENLEAKLGLAFAVFQPRRKPVVFNKGRESYTALLTRPFAISKTEVTNKQFKLFNASHVSGDFQGNQLGGDNQPVANVSWTQAALYANWLSKQAGVTPFYKVSQNKVIGFNLSSIGYRLVSEAEWVSVLQKDRPTRYMWGNAFDKVAKKSGNYADRSAKELLTHTLKYYDDGHLVSAPVGSFHANRHGIYDLEGNVAEWLHDVFSVLPNKENVNPLGSQRGSNHLIRGGSWKYGSRRMLNAEYRQYHQDQGKPEVGFRLAYYIK